MMAPLPTTTKPSDLDEHLKDKMADILALIEAIAAEVPDCDLKLAELLEGSTEQQRIAIVEKLRELLKVRAQEKEKELDKFLEAERRQQTERQRNSFKQWLQWMMSEETIRKMRHAFLAMPLLERQVRSIGHDLAARAMQAQLADKRDLGGLNANVQASVGKARDTGKGRE